MRLTTGRVVLLIIGVVLGLLYAFRRESFWPVMGLVLFIGIPTMMFMGRTSSKRRRRSGGFDADEWSAGNRHENGQGEY
jgi:hypothetical protein